MIKALRDKEGCSYISEMSSKERVMRAIEFKRPDRVPFTYNAIPYAWFRLGKELFDLLQKYPCDFFPPSTLKIPEPDYAHISSDGTYYKREVDTWGCEFEYREQGYGGRCLFPPLNEITKRKVQEYPIPNVPNITQEIRDFWEPLRNLYPVWGGFTESLFQRMTYLRGYENLLIDLYNNTEEINLFADRIIDYNLKGIEVWAEMKPDIIGVSGDDWGDERQTLISPELWRRFFKPRYQKLVDVTHRIGAKAWFHCDGYILPLLKDFIEIGADVINPQVTLMPIDEVARITKGRICVMPDLDRRGVMENGKRNKVYEHIRQIFDAFYRPEGGLIGYVPIELSPLDQVRWALEAITIYGKK